MRENQFESIKNHVQDIIDLIVARENPKANIKIAEVNQLLEELVDFSTNDEELIEISKFQLLLSQLETRIQNQ
jgi:hypothetical protein